MIKGPNQMTLTLIVIADLIVCIRVNERDIRERVKCIAPDR